MPRRNGYGFYGLTASTDKAIKHWRDVTGAEYPFYTTDGTTLKTIIRSNPGLVLLYKGTIINKWSHNDLPKQAELNAPLSLIETGREPENKTWTKIVLIIICYIFPSPFLLLLTAFGHGLDGYRSVSNGSNKRKNGLNKKNNQINYINF